MWQDKKNALEEGGFRAHSKMELLNLLRIIEMIFLVSGGEWDQVEVHHCTLYPVRKARGLQCKFQELYWKKRSTGDPDFSLWFDASQKGNH